MKRYVKQTGWLCAVVYAATVLLVAAQEPIEDLRVPVEYYPDGTLRTELFAARAEVLPDASIAASGIVFRVFSTNAAVEMTITAEAAVCSRERQSASSEKAVSAQQGDLLLTGDGFVWNGTESTLRVLRKARISFPSAMIKTERILKRED